MVIAPLVISNYWRYDQKQIVFELFRPFGIFEGAKVFIVGKWSFAPLKGWNREFWRKLVKTILGLLFRRISENMLNCMTRTVVKSGCNVCLRGTNDLFPSKNTLAPSNIPKGLKSSKTKNFGHSPNRLAPRGGGGQWP